MTKYAVSIHTGSGWQPLALFSDVVSESAMIAFAEAQFELGNSVVTPGDNIEIVNIETGEQIWSWKDINDTDSGEDCLPGQITLEDLYSPEYMFSCGGC